MSNSPQPSATEVAAVLAERDLSTRSLTLRADSINAEQRSFEAVVATESIAQVFDYRTYDVIDEILLADGGEFPESVPLLANHQRYSLEGDVLGSASDFRREGNQWVGRGALAVAVGENDPVERVWIRVRDRHIRAVSIGYRVTQFVDIPAGQQQIIGGRAFLAGERRLRISQRWQVHELSLTPIGADSLALIRTQAIEPGRRPSTTERTMEDNAVTPSTGEGPAATVATPSSNPTTPAAVRTEVVAATNDAASQTAIAAERQRCQDIHSLATSLDADAELQARAISEVWDTVRAAREFSEARRLRRGPGVAMESAPAGHVRGSEDITARALNAAILMDAGIDPVDGYFEYRNRHRVARRPAALELERAADVASQRRLTGLSFGEQLRYALQLDGITCGHRTYEIRDAMERAGSLVSLLNVTGVFTQNVAARLLPAYEGAEDTTEGWTFATDVNDFKTNERTRPVHGSQMGLHARGGEADMMKFSDAKETYAINRFSKSFAIDDMDRIDDAFGAIVGHVPYEMGIMARELRPDLVYTILMSNPNMRDSVALFHANHGNLAGSSAFSGATLGAVRKAIRIQTEGPRNLNLMCQYLLVPPTLQDEADKEVQSRVRITGENSTQGENNPNFGKGLIVVPEPRLENGVVNPLTGVLVAGSTSTWFATANRPQMQIEVGYLAETGRAPTIEVYALPGAAWGIGFKVKMDIGAKAIDWRTLYKRTAG
jgi:hypothetical protein